MSYSYKSLFRRLILAVFSVAALSAVFGVFAAGLPGEYLVTQRWRALNNNISPLSNPANIAEENYLAVRAAVAPILQGAFTLTEIGVNWPLGLYHTAGFTMLIEGAGAVYEDVPDPNTGRLVPGTHTYRNANFIASFGYAWHVWQRLVIGANLNFAYQTNFNQEPLMGTGIDIGANWRLMNHPLLGEHLVGIATQNLVAPTMGYSFVPDFESDAAYARNLRLSAYSKFWESRIENHLEFDLKDFFAKADNFSATGPGTQDFAKSLEWELNWRIGYWAMRMFKAYLIFGFDDNILGHWGLALGAQMPSFNRGRDLSAYYQYNIMTEESSDATSHSFYLKADFGHHREEVYARKMARMATLNPNELYNRGRRLYAEGRYWDAFFVFSRLLVEFPDFFRNDWVSLYRANCQEMLEMRDQSLANYNKLKATYSGEVVGHADLGIMRIHYRNNDFVLATNQFTELSRPDVSDSLRNHGAYIMGQIAMRNGEFRRAIHFFAMIPEGHPEYIFAQHSIAVAHSLLESDVSDVMVALENVMSVTPRTPEERELVHRSFLLMGFVFYEENALSKAVVALRNVPNNSYYTEDALLGLGWTALKARQWGDCIAMGQQLVRTTQRPALRAEGLLIQAYGHMLQREHQRAFNLLQEADKIARTLEMPNQDTLNARTMRDADNRATYSKMSNLVEEFAMMGQTAHVAGKVDSLKGRSDQYIADFHEHQRFRHEFQRGSFFTRTAPQIREDVEYALATVQRIMGARGQQRGGADIDAELERLRREIEGF